MRLSDSAQIRPKRFQTRQFPNVVKPSFQEVWRVKAMVKLSCPDKLGRKVRAMVKLEALPCLHWHGSKFPGIPSMVKFISRQPRPADRVNQEGMGHFNFTIKTPPKFSKIQNSLSSQLRNTSKCNSKTAPVF